LVLCATRVTLKIIVLPSAHPLAVAGGKSQIVPYEGVVYTQTPVGRRVDAVVKWIERG
jgi:hypothetical protein